MSIPAQAQTPSLQGSQASVARMAEQARLHDFSRLSTGSKIRNFFRGGLLVRLKGNRNYQLVGVSYPYVRREVRLFVERLSEQSRSTCRDGLIVTSSARPLNEQPRNASKRSVHPTGMAIDFRVPSTPRCRLWLEKMLLGLEGRRVVEATREMRPPHYHVAVFPKQYASYVSSLKKSATVKKKAIPLKVSPKRG